MKINGFVPDSKIFDKIAGGDSTKSADTTDNAQTTDFMSIFKQKLDEVNDEQLQADDITNQFIKGDGTDIHEVMLATEEAKMSLELAVQVRNKLVEAYQELNRMQM